MPQSRLDSIDIRILEAIQDNGRVSNVDLASKIGLSPSACLRRVQALESEGYVNGYSAQLNPKKLGLGVTAIVMVQIAQDNEEQMEAFQKKMLAFNEVVFCLAVTGVADYVLRVVAPDLEAYRALCRTRSPEDARRERCALAFRDRQRQRSRRRCRSAMLT